jgi:hypothetical protein
MPSIANCMRLTRWTALGALFACACAGKTESAPEPATPAPKAEPTAEASSTPAEEPSATTSAEPAPEPAAEGPKEESPGFASVRDLSPDKRKQLPDGFYFVDGIVTRLPCNACAKELACKPGKSCDHMKPCMYCNATVIIDDGTGHDVSIDHPDRNDIPRYHLGEHVRIVLQKKGLLRLVVRKSKPCPPSECLETEPAKKLKRAPKGVEVRRDGERCFAPEKCAPNAKCDPDAEVRVRCP